MADFDEWDSDDGDSGGADSADSGSGAEGGAPTPQINGGLLGPKTFPNQWAPAVTDGPAIQPQAPAITGPLMTDAHVQDILNAQAKLPPVPPHPETWSVNGQPYLAISARTFDPTRSNNVTSMPSSDDSAAAMAGRSQVAVPVGDAERGGYIAHSPSRVVPVTGAPGSNDRFDTVTYYQPMGLPSIHGHIDKRPSGSSELPSDGFVDSTEAARGLGDAWTLYGAHPQPLATVSHDKVGWHVLDNGQLKFLYPPGSMTSSQITEMQRTLDQEQRKFLRPK